MIPKIYQLKVSMMYSNPPIWRRILIDPDTLLSELHLILQTTMGWTNAHLHQFTHQEKEYSPHDPYNDDWDEMRNVDYTRVMLSDLLIKEKDEMQYVYDYGDWWEHQVLLEEIIDLDRKAFYPSCTGGENACPPEDCGGPGGYQELLAVMSDPTHAEYDEWMEWLEEGFDPKHFDIQEVNEMLRLDTLRG